MKTFLGMEVEQTKQSVKIQLDHSVKEVVAQKNNILTTSRRLCAQEGADLSRRCIEAR